MTKVGEKWSLKDMQSNDPLVVWSDWLPKSRHLSGKCSPEPRPCRKCFYEGHFCYKPRGSDTGCDSCLGKHSCNSDLTGVIPYRYKRAKIREKEGLIHPLLKHRLESQARRLEALKSDIELADTEKTPTFIEIEKDVEDNIEKDFENDSEADGKYDGEEDIENELGEDAIQQQELNGADPLLIYKEYVPKAQTRRDLIAEPRACRACFINGQNCYKKLGPAGKCNRCVLMRGRCTTDLRGAVPAKYKWNKLVREKGHSRRGLLPRQDIENETGIALAADLEADYLSISSGTERTEVEQVIADRDWSSASEDAIDENDEGLKTLALYQANPPKWRGEFGECIPRRRCLLERLCCRRSDGPDTMCLLCQGRADAGDKYANCSSDLRGAVSYSSKYGVDTVPGDSRPLFVKQGQARTRQPGKPKRRTKPPRPTNSTRSPDKAEPPEQAKPQQNLATDATTPLARRDDIQLESDESIIDRVFAGNIEDSGWKLLQMYFKHRRA